VAPESEEPREPGLAPLPPNEHRLVNDWWEEVGPVYTGKGGKDKCGWLLERGWNDDEKKKLSGPFGLNEKRLDRYLAQRCRIFFYLKGVRAVSTVQAFHYFTQYLVAHDYFSAAEAGRLQSAAKGLFETIRGAVDICDPAYRLCPTYAALIAGAEAAPTLPPVALATMSKAD
ncbi:MAG TPA: hypothetical protein VNU68_02655, partial [Verrucomicrobiae bacterium]|nr:hypothetical protein [Verrucomicrobiae bacterium]